MKLYTYAKNIKFSNLRYLDYILYSIIKLMTKIIFLFLGLIWWIFCWESIASSNKDISQRILSVCNFLFNRPDIDYLMCEYTIHTMNIHIDIYLFNNIYDHHFNTLAEKCIMHYKYHTCLALKQKCKFALG